MKEQEEEQLDLQEQDNRLPYPGMEVISVPISELQALLRCGCSSEDDNPY